MIDTTTCKRARAALCQQRTCKTKADCQQHSKSISESFELPHLIVSYQRRLNPRKDKISTGMWELAQEVTRSEKSHCAVTEHRDLAAG